MRASRRWFLAGVLATGLVALGGGLALSAAGLVPVAASYGHWRWAAWFLHFTMERAVATYSPDLKVPPLTDPALIRLGAAHFANACAPCHGGIDNQPLLPQQMTPPAPKLAPEIGSWAPAELHWIVKHGIRYSAMPAWPTQARDDDIWPVVAFLRAMPGLSESAYRALVGTDEPRLQGLGQPPSAGCGQCHGSNGVRNDRSAAGSAVPTLDGQSADYLAGSLRAYARGERYSGIMQPIAAELSESGIEALAEAYGRKDPSGAGAAGDSRAPPDAAASLERGSRIAKLGIAERGVPACVSCHGGSGRPAFPRLDGQGYTYLRTQLELFKAGRRGGTAYAPLMAVVAERLDARDIDDLARYYAARPRGPTHAGSSP